MPSGLSGSERKRLWASKGYYFSHGILEHIPDSMVGRFNFGKCWLANFGNVTNGTAGEGHLIPLGATVPGGSAGFLGIAAYREASCTNSSAYVAFTSSGTVQFYVEIHQNGIVRVFRGTPVFGTLLVTSTLGVFQDSNWFYLEVKGIVDATNGSVEVRINTKTVISLVAANTQGAANADVDSIQIGWAVYDTNEIVDFSLDDLYFCDDAGSLNNNFLGNVRVQSQITTGNSTPLNLSVGGSAPAATNWQSVQNFNLDDTKYVYSPNAGDEDLYTVQAILNGPAVRGVQISGAYRQDDATQRIARNLIKSGSTLHEGVDQYTNQTFTYYKDILELDPATGVGWTGAAVNLIKLGAKVQA